jgi:hypothetical protein
VFFCAGLGGKAPIVNRAQEWESFTGYLTLDAFQVSLSVLIYKIRVKLLTFEVSVGLNVVTENRRCSIHNSGGTGISVLTSKTVPGIIREILCLNENLCSIKVKCRSSYFLNT